MPSPRLIPNRHTLLLLALLMAACSDGDAGSRQPEPTMDAGREDTTPTDTADTTATPDDDTSPDTPDAALDPPGPDQVDILVLLDDEPAADTRVVQGGTNLHWQTDARGYVRVTLDRGIVGELYVMASHPDARIRGVLADFEADEPQIINLSRYSGDNARYPFQDPGEPGRRENTKQCGHCHQTINDAWYASPHRTSASNPVVQDMYAGVASGISTEEDCAEAGGRWQSGLNPGTTKNAMRCYIGDGLLPTLNPSCGDDEPCDEVATQYGDCANCHAPAINGQLGGRDLLDATGIAFDYGVSCDVCHKVDAVIDEAAPGIAGRLRLTRPGEATPSIALGTHLPLTFGPSHDSPNPRMGSVQRDHFRESRFCAGCHQHDQEQTPPGTSIDATRWPTGRLPIQSTFEEWRQGPMNPAAPCQSCHMPPDAAVLNSADLQRFELAEVGVQGGWHRPAGEVRRHSWLGPRQPEGQMLQLAAALFIDKTVADGTLTARVTVKNVGPGHAIPTGEPMRSMVLRVDATCDQNPLEATGGDAVPSWGGWLARKPRGEDWSIWPGAAAGEVIRVVTLTGGHYDYEGFGPFGDGTFDPEAKGMPITQVVGMSTVLSVDGDRVELDRPLPEGDIAYRLTRGRTPTSTHATTPHAGSPGFAFARVMRDARGREMAPHFVAVDVQSDNRLLPQQAWTSTHTFAAPCDDPKVRAVLVYRPFPFELARERRWVAQDTIMTQAER